MAGIFTDVWRIVKPATPKAGYSASTIENYEIYSNFSWYSKIMKGATSRLSKYSQYKNMDNDVFVARALDTIAEHMSPKDAETGMPFDIQYQTEVNTEIPESTVMTLRAALRHWVSTQELNKQVFNIARRTIKFGDCFFRKTSDMRKWVHVDSNDVLGITISKDTNKIEYYHLRKGTLNSNAASVGEIELVPAAGMVHFSLSTGLDELGPFGDSVLAASIKAYRHLTMLEDAVIIYRIVRAPERRVFNIDVGNLPPQRASAYLEAIKTDLRQKKVPNELGGQETVDGTYNPLSMQEDFFFAQTTDGRGTKIDTLPGGDNLGEITDLNFFQSKFLQGLRIPSSYMRGSAEGGSVINDGKVGVAYMEEKQFASYVKRLQEFLDPSFDAEFKAYLRSAQIAIDPNLFKIVLLDPQNFEIWQQAEIDDKLIANFSNLKEVPWIAQRTLARKYLRWSEDDIQANEVSLKQERGIPEGGYGPQLTDIRMIYDASLKADVKLPEWMTDFSKLKLSGGPEEEAPEEEPVEDEEAPEKDVGEKPVDDGAEPEEAPKGEPEEEIAPPEGPPEEPAEAPTK